MEIQDRDMFVKQAIDAVILLDCQLNLLLDAYDFYVERYPEIDQTDSQRHELKDLQVSIKAIGELPKLVTMQLTSWKEGREPLIGRQGFEEHVLNEFNLHIFSIASFMARHHIDIEQLDAHAVGSAFNALRHTARKIPASTRA